MSESNGQTSTALATIEDVAMVKHDRGRLEFTPEQEQMIRDMFMSGATDLEAQVLFEIARSRRLDPLRKQVHFVKRRGYDGEPDKWTAQVSIDGFRSIAEDTGLYDGQDEPELIEDAEGYLIVAKVRAYRKDISRPFVGIAYFAEFCQCKGNGDPTKMWKTMPRGMLAKCAEAQALRKAFPEKLGGLYTSDEMGQADNQAPPVVRQKPRSDPPEEPAPKADPPETVESSAARTIVSQLPTASDPDVRAAWDHAETYAAKYRKIVRGHCIERWIALAELPTDVDRIVAMVPTQGFPVIAADKLLKAAADRIAALRGQPAREIGEEG